MRREIQAYLNGPRSEHPRYRSWEHCYGFIQRVGPSKLHENRDLAALQLGFYLASWGMYRGSSFLLQHTYTIHCGVIDVLGENRFRPLWERDFGANESDVELAPMVLDLVIAIRNAYRPFAPGHKTTQPTDTLLTKVGLGTVGCLPACDRFFVDGFKSKGFKFGYFNRLFVDRVLKFCQEHRMCLQKEQAAIKKKTGLHYPLMKLVDMYFWQLGVEQMARGSA